MKKKVIGVIIFAILVMAISAPIAFAQSTTDTTNKSYVASMFDNMRSWLQQQLDSGKISKEEAKQWEDHFNAMQKFHEENGYGGGCGGFLGGNNTTPNTDGTTGNQYSPQGYRGYGRGMMGGYGRGMMGGYARSMMGNLY